MNKQNQRVLLLEWGSNAPVSGSSANFFLNAGFPGKSLLLTNAKFLSMIRCICTRGKDSKVIKIDKTGQVPQYFYNDKCGPVSGDPGQRLWFQGVGQGIDLKALNGGVNDDLSSPFRAAFS